MTVHDRRSPNPGNRLPRRCGLAVIAVGFGIAAATAHGVAWADTGKSESSEHQSSEATSGTTGAAAMSSGADSTTEKSAVHVKKTALQGDSFAKPHPQKSRVPKPASPRRTADSSPDAETKNPSVSIASPRESGSAAKPVSTTTTPTTTTPSGPGPLSPIAQIGALPGRVINTLLQVLDLTVSVGGPKSPIDFTPLDQLVFAAFRRAEGALGLDRTPAAQREPPTHTYTGPTTTPTPTVAQFLNASAAGYVLGGTPGGLAPFTVNGVQMTSSNVLSGESDQVWVTPEKQIIIAYQGTTGGTNLLFKPLMAVSQIIADAQVILTDTTPQAFNDSLTFEHRVQAAAAEQGYDASDVFLTGHSLGGWEAEYVAQRTGLGGVGIESPGFNTSVPGNGVDSGFVNIETYGDAAAYLSTDLPGLQPFMPAYVPGGGSKPHYGSIVMIGDPNATTPLINAASLWGPNPIGDAIFGVDVLVNFFEHHLPGIQAHFLGVSPDPGVVPWLGSATGPVDTGYGALTIPQLQHAASLAGTLIAP